MSLIRQAIEASLRRLRTDAIAFYLVPPAREHGLTRFTAVQNEYSVLVRGAERDVLPACERLGIGFVP